MNGKTLIHSVLHFSDALSVVINQIVDDYRTCEDLNRLSLGDITIGSRTYNGDDQTKLFVEAATHGNGTGHYCRKLMTKSRL